MAHVLGALKEWQWKLNQLNVPPVPWVHHGFHLKLRSRKHALHRTVWMTRFHFYWRTESIFQSSCFVKKIVLQWEVAEGHWQTKKSVIGYLFWIDMKSMELCLQKLYFPFLYFSLGTTVVRVHLYAWMVKWPSQQTQQNLNVSWNLFRCTLENIRVTLKSGAGQNKC